MTARIEAARPGMGKIPECGGRVRRCPTRRCVTAGPAAQSPAVPAPGAADLVVHDLSPILAVRVLDNGRNVRFWLSAAAGRRARLLRVMRGMRGSTPEVAGLQRLISDHGAFGPDTRRRLPRQFADLIDDGRAFTGQRGTPHPLTGTPT
jgi:hypothetical protein